jgi:predicted RecB family nuclease
MASPSDLRTCPNGHKYYKSTDCPTCPICEAERKPESGFLALLSAPARRAMENNGILTVTQLSKWTQKKVMKLHGVGPASLPVFKKVLEEQGLEFATE